MQVIQVMRFLMRIQVIGVQVMVVPPASPAVSSLLTVDLAHRVVIQASSPLGTAGIRVIVASLALWSMATMPILALAHLFALAT
jgi:hypothetical protein